MARRDDSKHDTGTPPRVFKSSDVHKRRVNRKGNPKEVGAPDANEHSRLQGQQSQHNSQVAENEGENGESAVVITPDFGANRKARQQSDDRWFAAMRESDVLAQPVAVESESGPDAGFGAEETLAAKAEEADAAIAGSQPVNQDLPPVNRSGDGAQADVPADQQADVQPDVQPGQQGPESGELPAQSQDENAAESQTEQDGKADQQGAERPSVARRLLDHAPSTLKGRIALAVTVVVIVAIAVGAAVFTWDRWYRFNDHADMQGEWYVVGTTVPVTIDESSIRLTDDVTYKYTINDRDKTIQYTFGPMEGQGRYWFSDDRQYLVITDGDEFTSSSTAFDDLLHMFSDLPDKVSGNEVKLPQGDGIIAFSRTPDAEALARQQAEAAAKAAAEEAARKEAERKAAEEAAAEEYYYYYYEEDVEEAPAEDKPAENQPAEGEQSEETPAEEAAPEEGNSTEER